METWRRELYLYAAFESEEDQLKHFGVKGMRWGIRKDEGIGDRSPKVIASTKSLLPTHNLENPERKAYLEKRGLSDDLFRVKHGAIDFLEEHKREIVIGSVIAATALAGGGLYLANRNGLIGGQSLGFNFNMKDVSLPAGSTLQRVSHEAEVIPRKTGFFCSFRPEDNQQYIRLGYGGVANTYKANVPVKAPSGPKTLKLFKEYCKSNPEAAKIAGRQAVQTRSGIKTITKDINKMSNKDWMMALSSNSRGRSQVSSPHNQFLVFLKDKGYNAIVDFQDAGSTSHSPLFAFDGDDFRVIDHRVILKAESMQELLSL